MADIVNLVLSTSIHSNGPEHGFGTVITSCGVDTWAFAELPQGLQGQQIDFICNVLQTWLWNARGRSALLRLRRNGAAHRVMARLPAVAVCFQASACVALLQPQLCTLTSRTRAGGRRDDDGTYVVQMSSCEHAAAPEPAPAACAWFAPVRCRVEYSGYTLAPLQAQFTSGGPSQETLVTHVLKVRRSLTPTAHPSNALVALWGFSRKAGCRPSQVMLTMRVCKSTPMPLRHSG